MAGLFGAFLDKIMGSIPPEQHNGAESMVAGLAEGAAGAAVAADYAKPVTAEIANLGREAASGIPIMQATDYLTTPGDGMARGPRQLG